MKSVPKGKLADRAVSGAILTVRATPAAGAESVEMLGDVLAIRVTQPAEDGRANDAIRRLLARALGVAPGRLTLIQGATSRDKRFRLD